MTGTSTIAALYRVELALVLRHLMGCPESARDRIGARHRRVMQLYCAGWCQGVPFACLIRDPGGAPVTTRFGADAPALSVDAQRSIRLRALRQVPVAVWHYPYPLESAADYSAQEELLMHHLAGHAEQAGWTGTSPDAGMRVERAGMPQQTLPPAHAWCPQPPMLQEGPAQRIWAPDPDAPPARIRVFPGWIHYHGCRYQVTGRERTDPKDNRLAMEYRADDAGPGSELWLNESGRLAGRSA